MDVPDLESSKQLNRLLTGYLNKIRFHTFQNRSKFSIHGLRPLHIWVFYLTLYKDNRGKIMVKISVVIHEEVIDVFREKIYIPTI